MSETGCPYSPILKAARATGFADPGISDELFAHLALGCEHCLLLLPRELRQLFSLGLPGRQEGHCAPSGRAAASLLTGPALSRWFAHRGPVELFPFLDSWLGLPLAEQLYRLLAAPELEDLSTARAFAGFLDSLVITRPAYAGEVARAGRIFAAAVAPEVLPAPIAWDIYLRAVRASSEVALAQGNWPLAQKYAFWLDRIWDAQADPYEIAETSNTQALFEACRGMLPAAVAMLKEGMRAVLEAGDFRLAGKLLSNAAHLQLLDGAYLDAGESATVARTLLMEGGGEGLLVQHAEDLEAQAKRIIKERGDSPIEATASENGDGRAINSMPGLGSEVVH